MINTAEKALTSLTQHVMDTRLGAKAFGLNLYEVKSLADVKFIVRFDDRIRVICDGLSEAVLLPVFYQINARSIARWNSRHLAIPA